PERPVTQVEVSATDARILGIAAPVRESGSIKESGSCKVVGPKGEIELSEGVIVAKRHIHATPADAERLGVKDKEVVAVRISSCDRSLIFEDVVVRVSDKFALAMHIDTDEANAAGCAGKVEGDIIRL
ncbi:MAG: PduL/EutD family phosphate acyltransferase, partial [Acetanaerobacterium sp.]